MEEELWLLEEMLQKPPHLVLNHLPETARSSSPSPENIATPEPYDPANPGFVRPDRRPVKLPSTETVSPSMGTSVPKLQPQRVSHGLFKRKRPKMLIRPATTGSLKLARRPGTSASQMEDLFGASPTRETPPTPRRVPDSANNVDENHNTTTNPGPRQKRSPQLIAASQKTKPARVEPVVPVAEPVAETVVDPVAETAMVDRAAPADPVVPASVESVDPVVPANDVVPAAEPVEPMDTVEPAVESRKPAAETAVEAVEPVESVPVAPKKRDITVRAHVQDAVPNG
ncbi:protein STU1-like [Cotesia glomerata]|uniref:protein STU1-like n=1 Tax=Cotesia glomerata TaxID=32391 RepID=UPI001D019854|nr:protein STU1-like [Cotesia glomerata]